MKPNKLAIAFLLACFFSSAAYAEEHVVNAQATKFHPVVVFAKPGDSIVWKNMSGHDAQSMESLIPEGAEHWHVPMGSDGSVVLEVEGVYVYKCTPHFALGMVGGIVVGEPSNMEQVEANAKGMAKRAVIKMKKAIAAR